MILSLWQQGTSHAALAQFAALGIPVAFVDMFVDPIAHTAPSLKLLGALLGQPQAGAAYAAFYTQKLDTIRAAGLSMHPQSVMLQVYPGMMECCWVAGRSGFGQYIPLAGGSEIGAAQFAAPFGGQLALEYVLKSDPRFYIATGLSATSGNQGLVIGFGVDKETASTSLAQVLQAEHCRHSGSSGATRFWAVEFL